MDNSIFTDPKLQRWSEIAMELYRRVYAEEAPEIIYDWWLTVGEKLRPSQATGAIMPWPDSFEIYDREIERRREMAKRPESEQRLLTWPWSSWNRLLDPAEGGMLSLLAGPDAVGKTAYAECIAEHWAKHGHQVVFVHFELSKNVMLDRRAARHTAIARRRLKFAGSLTPDEMRKLEAVKHRLLQWPGEITYLHVPGKTFELVLRELTGLKRAGKCSVAVIDYLEKASPAAMQLKAYGSNLFAREAADVELLKSWSERHGVPLLVLSQFNKAGKHAAFGDLDRTMIRGAGEKTEKANVVILLQPDKSTDGIINVRIDKNTLGPTGTFRQLLDAAHFRSEEHTSELQSHSFISYAVFCLKKKKIKS